MILADKSLNKYKLSARIRSQWATGTSTRIRSHCQLSAHNSLIFMSGSVPNLYRADRYRARAALYGLRHFRYMTVSVQRGGHFQYMTTSVHMRSISVHVFFAVRLRYMRSTILVHHYVDIGTLQENVNFLCWQSKKCPVDVSLFLVWVQLNVVVHARHQSLTTADRSESKLTSTNTSPLTSRFRPTC